MGRDIDAVTFTGEDRAEYRDKLRACLDAFRRMLDDGRFETGRKLAGIEVELYVVDTDGIPVNINAALLESMASEDFQTELAQFNIEFNLAPHKLVGTVFSEFEEELETAFEFALDRANDMDAHAVMIGIMPTLEDFHVKLPSISANPRYSLLNDQVLAARGEDVAIDIEGPEQLKLRENSIMLEAAATSVQLHLQVTPEGFPAVWNAAQAIAAAQVAVGANSPWLLGKELWRETRIAVFEQTLDTRTEELAAQGVRPRVWFGERWIDGALDLWEENITFFPALLPLVEEQDPIKELEEGHIPHLPELTLHNGTIYRWNRPVFDVARGKPHLRVENRVLPAGPSAVDTIANAAFYYGLVRAVADLDEPISTQLSFSAARENFLAAARDGMDAQLYWPGLGNVPASELVLRTLLPMAREGLDAWEIKPRDRDFYLGIIEQRAMRRRNGASWQVEVVRSLLDGGMPRHEALMEMTRRYMRHQRANEPVHTWPID